MSEAILASRLEALDGDLDRVDDSLRLVEQLQLSLRVPSELSSRVRTAVQGEISSCRTKLKRARALLTQAESGNGDRSEALKAAWEEFADVQQSTRALFSGCLEFLGGLAFRDDRVRQSGAPLPDDVVWEIADGLIAESVNTMWGFTQPFLTVPALDESICDSVVSTVRLRFPEWSMWSLPLGAYEFGHIALVERPLEDYFREVLRQRADAAGPEIRRGHWRFTGASRENRLRVLLADAFATLHLGLAYGAAALHLRLDPVAAHAGTPTNDERATVIIAALRTLADDYLLDAALLNAQIDQLERDWQDAVARAAPAASPTVEHEPIDDVLPSLTGNLRDALASPMVYGPERWTFATTIATGWLGAPAKRQPLATAAQPSSMLRDVLNAAWLCRLMQPEHAALVAPAALEMARRYLEGEVVEEEVTGGAGRRPGAVGRFGGGA